MHERWQPTGDEEQWSDSFYFGGGDGRGLAFYSRVGRRPNEGRHRGRARHLAPGQGFLLSFARGGLDDAIACRPGAFRLRAAAAACGSSASRAAGGCSSAPSTSRRRRDRTTRPSRSAASCASRPGTSRSRSGPASPRESRPPTTSSRDRSPARSRSASRRHALAGRGMRDHSWGVRDWQAVPYWRWFGMIADPDNFLVLNNVGTPDGGEVAGGFLMRDGVVAPIDACETSPSSTRSSAASARSWRAPATRRAARRRSAAAAIEVAPLRQRRDGRLTLVNEGAHRIRLGRRRGIGISEYLIQRPDRDDGSRLAPRTDLWQRPGRAASAPDPLRHDEPAGQRGASASRSSTGCCATRASRRRILRASPDRPNLVARLPGRGAAPPLLLYGHVDVVTTAGQRWQPPPVRRRRCDDGYVWGRGALDMKGGVAMMLSALPARQGRGPGAGRAT